MSSSENEICTKLPFRIGTIISLCGSVGQVVFKNNFAAGVAVLRSENLSQNDTGADVILLV
jgi:hypothetical protein